jgi:cyclin H
MAINTDSSQPVASSSKTTLVPGPTTFHESSQFRHWRYSQSQLRDLRLALNAKSVEVVTRNSELEKVCSNS